MDRQKRPFAKIFVKVGGGCGWKKNQYHKEKDSLKVVTVLRVNKLYTQKVCWYTSLGLTLAFAN